MLEFFLFLSLGFFQASAAPGGEKAYVEKIVRKGRWQVITLMDSAIRMGPAVAIAPPTGGVCRAIFSR